MEGTLSGNGGLDIFVILALIGIIIMLPVWPDASSWTYGFGALVGALMLTLLILLVVIITKVKAAILNEPTLKSTVASPRR